MKIFAVYTERSKSTDLIKLFQKEEDAVKYVRLSDRVDRLFSSEFDKIRSLCVSQVRSAEGVMQKPDLTRVPLDKLYGLYLGKYGSEDTKRRYAEKVSEDEIFSSITEDNFDDYIPDLIRIYLRRNSRCIENYYISSFVKELVVE